jgi:adenylosuccinate synthase
MRETLLVMSGPICAGKSTLAEGLQRRYGARRLSSRQLLQQRVKDTGAGRLSLQAAGEELDRETQGRWLAESLRPLVEQPGGPLVVDSVRIRLQVEALRQVFGSRVVHVHLTAPAGLRERRYDARRAASGQDTEGASFARVGEDATERAVEGLADVADLVLDTSRLPAEAVLVRVASQMGLFGRGVERLVDVLIGGQYGSEGKGHLCSYLAPEYDLLVRVGGPNAGHRVYEEPMPYTFHQLPSGTRAAPQARVVLGPGAVLSRQCLSQEIQECRMTPERLFIDPQASVIEPQDVTNEVDRLKAIASTAQGVGFATARKVLRTAAEPGVVLARDVAELRPFLRPAREVLEDAYARGQRILLEGTQGTGLSLHHGRYPYVTSRDTTVSGCLSEAGIAPGRVRKTLLVCRTYPIRVQNPDLPEGTSGPLAGELTWAEISRRSGIAEDELLQAERTSTTKRQRRVAEFDWALLRETASLNAPTDVALTFLDYLAIEHRAARRFEQLRPEARLFVEEIERVAGAPVSLLSTRFHPQGLIDRRAW